MEALKYFLDTRHGLVLAYEEAHEFFVQYIPEENTWKTCGISFMAFRHDGEFKEIDREDAARRTNGNLPEAMLDGYLSMIRKNLSGGR